MNIELTKAEEQIMQIFWKKGKCFVNEIVDEFGEPKPAYNTVSTIIRILEKKGFVSHNAFGRTYQYFPLINQKDYSGNHLRKFIKNYFNNSYRSLTSFFAEDNQVSIKELEKIRKIIDEEITRRKCNE